MRQGDKPDSFCGKKRGGQIATFHLTPAGRGSIKEREAEMDNTQVSLLLRARQGEESAWRRLVDLYQPLIRCCLLRQQVRQQEAEDLTQDVLAVLVKELPHFEHAGRPGAFRAWLRTVTLNRARLYWRAGSARGEAAGGREALARLEALADPDSELSRLWDEEHDAHVLGRLLGLLEQEFEPVTLHAFRRLAFDGASGQEVADELGMSVAAVYGARSRVLQRLRQEAQGLLD
jgi:RNA polymerase sigma-70 factor (ECF subfamily)